MKKKSMFLRVFWECFNQLKLPGIIFLSMWALGYAFAFFIGSMDSSLNTIALILCGGYILFSVLIIPIATLIFVFKAFDFLFKRKSCDFYHALPIKRQNLFFANSLACFSWNVILAVLPLITVLLHSISVLSWDDISPIFNYLYQNLLTVFIYTFGISIMTVTVTGLRIPAIINTLILVLLPNVSYYVFRNGLFANLPFLVENAPGVLPEMDVLNMFSLHMVSSDSFFSVFYLVAGITYYGLGLLFFVKRKSETAEKSAPNKFLKTVYCALAGFTLSIISNSLIILENYSTWILICYGLAVIICFAYEFLTEKGVKAIKRALISTAALILINVMFLGSFYGLESMYRFKRIEIDSFRPRVRGYDMTSSYTKTKESWGEFYPVGNGSYGSLMVRDYLISDEAACEKLEEILADISRSGDQHPRFQTASDDNNIATKYCFTIKDKRGKTHYRNIPLYQNEYASIVTAVVNAPNSEFLTLVTKLPEKEELSSVMIKQQNNLPAGEIELDDYGFYDLFVKEYANLNPSEKASLLYNAPAVLDAQLKNSDNTIHTIFLTIEGKHLNNDFKSIFIVDSELMPDTFKAALTIMDGNRQLHFRTLKTVFATGQSIQPVSPFEIKIEYDTRFETRPQYDYQNVAQLIKISATNTSVKVSAYGQTSQNYVLTNDQGAQAIGFITDKITPVVNGYNCKISFSYTKNGRTFSHYLAGYILPADYELIYDYIKGIDRR